MSENKDSRSHGNKQEYAVFEKALKKVLSVSREEIQARIAAEKGKGKKHS
jgi:hypothetical protein